MKVAEEREIRALVWSEWSEPREVYPKGIHGAVAEALEATGRIETRTVQLGDPEQGASTENLEWADVLFWWGHAKHGDVKDELAQRVARRVIEAGMGFVPIHSAHFSKPFIQLMGTGCGLGGWREDGKPEHVKVLAPGHPIAKGISDFVVPEDEMYNEPFDVPEPEVVVFHSRFEGGEQFRSGCCWTRGKGRVFYFRPGHETYPVMFQPEIKRILQNAAFWAARRLGRGPAQGA